MERFNSGIIKCCNLVIGEGFWRFSYTQHTKKKLIYLPDWHLKSDLYSCLWTSKSVSTKSFIYKIVNLIWLLTLCVVGCFNGIWRLNKKKDFMFLSKMQTRLHKYIFEMYLNWFIQDSQWDYVWFPFSIHMLILLVYATWYVFLIFLMRLRKSFWEPNRIGHQLFFVQGLHKKLNTNTIHLIKSTRYFRPD